MAIPTESMLKATQALQARNDELSKSLSLMQATLESTADGILVTDTQGRVVTFNSKFLSIWKVAREAVEGARHHDIVRLSSRRTAHPDAVLTGIDRIYSSPRLEAVDLLDMTDGQAIERHSRPQYVNSQIVGRVWSYRDVTDTRRVEEAMRDEQAARVEIARVSRIKDEFLSTLSHELRTPMTSILGWAKILLRKKSDLDTVYRGLEVIERNAVAQSRLIEDLLDMNRLVSGQMRLDVRPVDALAVVDAAIETVASQADGKGVTLRTTGDTAAGAIAGDAARLQQVVWNLLTNAIKFTPKGGEVNIAIQRVDARLDITISDTGSGISAEFLPHVFDRFSQSDSSITRTHGGLGLGLSIVKHLVELHGGSVRALSDGDGHGATFIVSLPLAAVRSDSRSDPRLDPRVGAGKAADSTMPTPMHDTSLQGLKILVVDDQPDARELIGALLIEHHAEVHAAASAAEALATLQRVRPDLIVSDIGMPERDGYQLIADIRKLAPEHGGLTPAIAITAFAQFEDKARAMLAGFQAHLSKPIEPQELIGTAAGLSGRDLYWSQNKKPMEASSDVG
jgi:signal transduction histidine kinase/ActR/RegA family two-component response regulator